MSQSLTLSILDDVLCIVKLAKDSQLPEWAAGDFVSVTRTSDELSIVCAQGEVPSDVIQSRDWRCLKVMGTLDFSLVGVLRSLVTPLAESDISVFAVSTFETDYLLVKSEALPKALDALKDAGHILIADRS